MLSDWERKYRVVSAIKLMSQRGLVLVCFGVKETWFIKILFWDYKTFELFCSIFS